MTFSVTFSKNETITRTNLVHDPFFTYRPLNTTGNSLHLFRWGGAAPYGNFTADKSKFGGYSFYLTPTTSSPDVVVCQNTNTWQYFPTTPFQDYQGSCWVYATGDCTIRTDIDWYDDPDNGTSFDYDTKTTTVTGGVWTQVYITKWAPSGAYGADFYIEKQATATAVGVYITGVMFERIDFSGGDVSEALPGLVFDGDIPPAYPPANATVTVDWAGTSGQSTSTVTYETEAWTDDTLSIDVRQGRESAQDFTTPGSCTIDILNATKTPDLGVLIRVYYNTKLLYVGFVQDTEIIYSMTPGLDVLRVTGESYIAKAGRAETTRTGGYNKFTSTEWRQALRLAGLEGAVTWSVDGVPRASFNDYEGNLLTFLQRLTTTCYGTMWDDADGVYLRTGGASLRDAVTSGFTDDLPVTDQIVYSGIRFNSKADNYVTLVRVEPDRDGQTPVDEGSGFRSLIVQSFSVDQASVAYLAKTYLKAYENPQSSPREITIEVAAQPTEAWADIINGGFHARRESVTFRGSTYPMVVQGFALSATPDSARVTYYLEPVTAYPFLVLDDPDVGLLDTNVLYDGTVV